MAILSKDNDVFTVMVEITTTPETQEPIIEAMNELAGLFPEQPGFVSQHYHRSHDGTRVINYLQWRSEEDHQRCHQNPELQPRGAELMKVMEQSEAQMAVRTFEVTRSDEASGASAIEELVLAYFHSWQRQDWDTMRACLADELDLEGPDGARPMSADAFIDMCKNGAPWRDVTLFGSLFGDRSAALFYKAVDTSSGAEVRVGEHITVVRGKIARLRGVFGAGAPPA